ncbi:glycosyltransferase [Nocardioides sp.]|uniref:glycosyltransferase n=1 Tax=Nocardioides sp. TaxID=35761 RepID=UPI0031FE81A7|nr:hypothetical protein [Nocardioides sp.]
MIGYYVHHVGRGHLHRACQLAAELEMRGESVTGLSSLPRPEGWVGEWAHLPRDDRTSEVEADAPTARGRLHWAPVGHAGLRGRMAQIARWIDRAAPAAVVCDVSVEVELLARLHGVRVVTVVLPGTRDDPAHLLGFDVADLLVGFWPSAAHGMLRGTPYDVKERVHAVGALSRFSPVDAPPASGGVDPRGSRPGSAVLLWGAGGHAVTGADIASMRAQTPSWHWTVLGGSEDTWVDDPWEAIRTADVVVTHAGQNALAEIAAAQRPAVVLPQERPHDEQRVTAAILADGDWPAVVRESWPTHGWSELLGHASGLDGSLWTEWCDGRAAQRFADSVQAVAGQS